MYFRGDKLVLTDKREAIVTDIPSFDSDLLIVDNGNDLETINTFQVAENVSNTEFNSLMGW